VPPLPVVLLPLAPVLLEPVLPLAPVLVLLFGTMPGGHLLAALDMLLVLLLELLLVVPVALEVPAGTQSLAESAPLGLVVLELELGLLVLPPELVCARAGSAMIKASAVVARICFTRVLPR
jgi:hypothetical protein